MRINSNSAALKAAAALIAACAIASVSAASAGAFPAKIASRPQTPTASCWGSTDGHGCNHDDGSGWWCPNDPKRLDLCIEWDSDGDAWPMYSTP